MSFTQNIKNKLAVRAIRKVLERQNRKTHFADFKSVKSVLILFEADSEDKNFYVKNCVKELEGLGKKVFAWGYLNQKEIVSPVFPQCRLFANKDLSFAGVPNDALLNEFAQVPCEMVILLSVHDVLPLDFLLAVSKAPFKVSKTKPYKGITDFMIELNKASTESFLYKQILFYLENIKGK